MGELYDAYEQRKYQEVQRDTWGHLAPEVNKKYECVIHVVNGYNFTELLSYEVKDLGGSPWLHTAVCTFALAAELPDVPAVYEFKGWCKANKDGTYAFTGGNFKKVWG
jgi:hypothetical protein